MANIKISNIHPAGSELFLDSESYMKDLNDSESILINGAGRSSWVCNSSWDCAKLAYKFFKPLPSPKRPDIPFSA